MPETKLYSTRQAAEALGISVARVKQIRADRHNDVGTLIGRSLVFTEDDLEKMRVRRPVGRPPADPAPPSDQ